MKKLVLLIGLGIILLSQVSFASAKSAKPNRAITTNPIDFIISDKINIKYEQMLERKKSFTVEFFYDNHNENAPGFGIGCSYRWYFRSLIPVKTVGVEGFSAGPYARMGWYIWEVNEGTTEHQAGIDLGGEIAYKFILGKYFAIEPMIRMGWGIGGTAFSNNKGFHPWPGVSLGLAW